MTSGAICWQVQSLIRRKLGKDAERDDHYAASEFRRQEDGQDTEQALCGLIRRRHLRLSFISTGEM